VFDAFLVLKVTDNNQHQIDVLAKYLPEGTAEGIWQFIVDKKVKFRIAKPRKSKLGDYRPPYGKHGHRISVNADLNPYAFLITVVHEFAHLVVWEAHKNRKAPHGKEWKQTFRSMLTPYMSVNVFPEDVQTAVVNYIDNPAASSCADVDLSRALNRYNKVRKIMLDDLPDGSSFKLKNNMVFEKGQKLRKRYKCLCLTNNKWYYVSGVAEVIPIDTQAKLF